MFSSKDQPAAPKHEKPRVRAEGEVGSPPISRVLSWAVIPLGGASPRRSCGLPGSSASHTFASLFGLAPDGVLRAVRVATNAVSSYLSERSSARSRPGGRRLFTLA